nr:MAG TPA: hypothetical protein [Caudoviricetes sp.]
MTQIKGESMEELLKKITKICKELEMIRKELQTINNNLKLDCKISKKTISQAAVQAIRDMRQDNS